MVTNVRLLSTSFPFFCPGSPFSPFSPSSPACPRGGEPRPLRISRTAVVLLLEYKQWQDAQRERPGDAWQDTDGRVFTSEEGKPLFPDAVTKWFTELVKRTGLPRVAIHSLRHACTSLMIADGTPLVVVSHKPGHAQTSTTANIYAHVCVEAEEKADQAFDRFGDLINQERKDGLKKDKRKTAGI